MPRWNPSKTNPSGEDFKFGGTSPVIPADYTALLTKVANVRDVDETVLYIDYTKGTETGLELRIELSNTQDPSSVSERFYQIGVLDTTTGVLVLTTIKIAATGKYRMPLPTLMQEDRLRVAIRDSGLVGGNGSGEIQVGFDNPESVQTLPKPSPF